MPKISLLITLLMTAWAHATPLDTNPLADSGFGPHLRTLQPVQSFAVDGKLRKNFEFWIRIYSQHPSYQGVIHDAKQIEKIYEVVDLSGLDHKAASKKVKAAKERIRALLRAAGRKQSTPHLMSEEERGVYLLWSDSANPRRFEEAASSKRLRFQLGQADLFKKGLIESGRYLARMEKIFQNAGLPVELTRLPFVESGFNLKARSKVGASGIWQFMRSTGRIYLRINDAVDERNDPIRATEAAARLLRQNYESLGSWPLAVTAYNHGREGMLRAVRSIGSEELDDVVAEYRSRLFGFASGNFFTELLAAIEVERRAQVYFGFIERAVPLLFFEVTLPDSIAVKDLVQFLRLDLEKVRELNPALLEPVWRGRLPIPSGYQLRMPLASASDSEVEEKRFWAGYQEIPPIYKGKYGRKSR